MHCIILLMYQYFLLIDLFLFGLYALALIRLILQPDFELNYS